MDIKVKQTLHQFAVALSPGDAISDEVLLLQKWLHTMGFDSEIYVEYIHPDYADRVTHHTSYQPEEKDEIVILHYSIGGSLIDNILSQSVRFLLIYHNLTPAEFFKELSPQLAAQLEAGREALTYLIDRCAYVVSDSEYNRQELLDIGFPAVDVLPICINEAHYEYSNDTKLEYKMKQKGPNLLFVGRMVPSKKQEDLIKLLYFYKRFSPDARLWLVGSVEHADYVDWLRYFANELGLQENVIFAGHVTQQELITHYRNADLYISMSEHEGFGKPLIESMYTGLPILAYHSSAVPYTLDDSGILFHHKHYEALAEVAEFIYHNEDIREQIIKKQRAHGQQFLSANVFLKWKEIINNL